MSVGPYISGAAHAGLIGWLVIGWGLNADPLDFPVTEVSLVSGAAFDAAVRAGMPDAPALELAAPVAPTLEPDAAPPMPVITEPEAAPPAPPTAPAPDVAADRPAPPEPRARPEVAPDPVLAPVAPPTNLVVEDTPRPQERPVDRIAPTAALAPALDAAPSDRVQESTVPTPAPEAAAPQEQTAPEAAATEVVTEAEQPAGAPEISLRPRARPARPAPEPERASEPDPTPAPEPTPEPTPEPAPTPPVDPVAQALAEALSGAAPATQGDPGGTSLTAAEIGSFRNQVGACWNPEAASTDSLAVTPTLIFELTPDGHVVPGSIIRAGAEGGDANAQEIAYRVAERAVLECATRGRDGYDLPPEKYDQWRELKFRFNPETMRLR